jgi:hypothetical protein
MTVPIPMRMLHLKRDPRGYPIPAGVLIDKAGVPHFAINEETTRMRQITQDRCGICDGTLVDTRWFVGGARGAFHDAGAYLDPPMHDECAHYALLACPFLAARSYSRHLGDKQAHKAAISDNAVFVDQTMIGGRPEIFVAVLAQRTITASEKRFVKPSRPYLAVEFWRHGERLADTEGWEIVDRIVAAPLPSLKAPRLVRAGRNISNG